MVIISQDGNRMYRMTGICLKISRNKIGDAYDINIYDGINANKFDKIATYTNLEVAQNILYEIATNHDEYKMPCNISRHYKYVTNESSIIEMIRRSTGKSIYVIDKAESTKRLSYAMWAIGSVCDWDIPKDKPNTAEEIEYKIMIAYLWYEKMMSREFGEKQQLINFSRSTQRVYKIDIAYTDVSTVWGTKHVLTGVKAGEINDLEQDFKMPIGDLIVELGQARTMIYCEEWRIN